MRSSWLCNSDDPCLSCVALRSLLVACVSHLDDLGVLLIHGAEAFLAVALIKHTCWVLLLMVLICLHGLLVVVKLNFFVDELFVLGDLEAEEFEIEVKI